MPDTARQSAIALQHEENYSPAMRKLTDNRKRFVIAYVYYTGARKCALEAVRLAGFGGTDAAMKTTSYLLMQNQQILDAIYDETKKLMIGYGARSAHRLNELIDSDNEKVALDAAKSMLGFAGHLMNRTQHTVTHEYNTQSTAELIAFVQTAMAKIDTKKLLTLAAREPVEADFEEVEGAA